MDAQQLRNILESCLLVAGRAMSLKQLESLFAEDIDRPDRAEIKAALIQLQDEYQGRGIELVEVATGWRLQSCASMAHWVGRLFQEKPPRYSRALLETLVLIAYRQPITRGEIEDIRGVAVSSNIIKTLQEREWIREMGYKDVPGRPALWGTTRQFLDYFNLQRLDELPTLAEARDLADVEAALAAEIGIVDGVSATDAANDSETQESSVGDGTPVSEDISAQEGVSTEGDISAQEGVGTERDISAQEGVSTEGDISAQEGVSTEGDISAQEGVSTEKDVSAQEGISTGEDEVDQIADNASDTGAGSELITLAGVLPGAEFEGTTVNPESGKHAEHASNVDTDQTSMELDALSSAGSVSSNGHGAANGSEHNESGRSAAATEISAHDLVIEEIPSNDSEDGTGKAEGDEHEAFGSSGQAESALREAIDSFADEHQQQLDRQNQLRTSATEKPQGGEP